MAKLSKEKELAILIIDKCQESGCDGPNEVAEMLGKATCIILDVMGQWIGASFNDMLTEYVRGLSNVETNAKK